ncbi:MAG: hypothetical protein JXA20_06535, partial [Spirochaetes bacterium]|nr:hypothetical protein [Spirochaetota bacterium]
MIRGSPHEDGKGRYMDSGVIRQRLITMHWTPRGILAMLFLFTLVFLWIFIYAPMLLGVPEIEEAMFIVDTGRETFFSEAGMADGLRRYYPAVLICALFSFFFLDVRKYFPLMITVAATPRFLAEISGIAPVPLRADEINSLFLVSQFVAMSFPFVLLERYSGGSFASWKEYLQSRRDFRKRCGVMARSAAGLCKELAVAGGFIALGFVPSCFADGVSNWYVAAYFAETAMVFLFSFYIVGGYQLIFGGGKKTDLRGITATAFLYLAGLFLCVLLVPMLLGLIFSPFFAPFGQGGLRAGVAYAPGTTYLFSFYFMHLFLHSGLEGLATLPLFLLSACYVSGNMLSLLRIQAVQYTIPAAAGMTVTVAAGLLLCAVTVASPPGEYRAPRELFSFSQKEGEGPFDDIFPGKGDIYLSDRTHGRVSRFDVNTKVLGPPSILLDGEGRRYRGVIRNVLFVQTADFPVAAVVTKESRGRGGAVRFYRLHGIGAPLRPVAKIDIGKDLAPAAMALLDGDVIALFANTGRKGMSAFSVHGKRWIWNRGDIGGAGVY